MDVVAQAREQRGDFIRVAEARGEVLVEQLEHHPFELGRHVGDELRGRNRRLRQVPATNRGGRPLERGRPHYELVQHAAERVEIAARVDELAADLFGRHVRNGAGRAPLRFERFATRGPWILRRQPEVDDDRLPLEQHDVLRLQVAIDESFAVEKRERRADASHDSQDGTKLSGGRSERSVRLQPQVDGRLRRA